MPALQKGTWIGLFIKLLFLKVLPAPHTGTTSLPTPLEGLENFRVLQHSARNHTDTKGRLIESGESKNLLILLFTGHVQYKPYTIYLYTLISC